MSCSTAWSWGGVTNPGLLAPYTDNAGNFGVPFANNAAYTMLIPTRGANSGKGRISWSYVNPQAGTPGGAADVLKVGIVARGLYMLHPLRTDSEYAGAALAAADYTITATQFFGPTTCTYYTLGGAPFGFPAVPAPFPGTASYLTGAGSWENRALFEPIAPGLIPYQTMPGAEIFELSDIGAYKYIELLVIMGTNNPGNVNSTAQYLLSYNLYNKYDAPAP